MSKGNTQQQQTVELPDNEAVGVIVGGIGVSGGLCGVNILKSFGGNFSQRVLRTFALRRDSDYSKCSI